MSLINCLVYGGRGFFSMGWGNPEFNKNKMDVSSIIISCLYLKKQML